MFPNYSETPPNDQGCSYGSDEDLKERSYSYNCSISSLFLSKVSTKYRNLLFTYKTLKSRAGAGEVKIQCDLLLSFARLKTEDLV